MEEESEGVDYDNFSMTVISEMMIIVFVEHTPSNIKMCDDFITSKVLSSGMSVDKVLNPGINRIVKKED